MSAEGVGLAEVEAGAGGDAEGEVGVPGDGESGEDGEAVEVEDGVPVERGADVVPGLVGSGVDEEEVGVVIEDGGVPALADVHGGVPVDHAEVGGGVGDGEGRVPPLNKEHVEEGGEEGRGEEESGTVGCAVAAWREWDGEGDEGRGGGEGDGGGDPGEELGPGETVGESKAEEPRGEDGPRGGAESEVCESGGGPA